MTMRSFLGYTATGIALIGLGFFWGFKYASRASKAEKDNAPRIYATGVDLDGNGLEDLFREDPGRKTISVLWGDYTKLRAQSHLQRTSNDEFNRGLVKFASQNEGFLVPISRNYQQTASQSQNQPKPEVVETPRPRDSPQEPDYSKIPSFEIKPLSDIAYFETATMIARHPERRVDYGYIESQVKGKYEKMINDPCVKND